PLSLIPPSQHIQDYLSNLSSISLQSLLDEPGELQTQSHHLTSSLSSLIHTAYPTFLALHDNTRALGSSLSTFSDSLDQLLNSSLPDLDVCIASWREKTEGLLADRRSVRLVLEQHDKVRDLLDIPLLMEACVRNGYFAEVLSLKNHVESLVAIYIKSKGKDKEIISTIDVPSQPPQILSSLLSEVHYAIDQMHLMLLQTLHDPTKKLPALWKAVNFLRKMDAFHDHRVNEEEDRDVINERKTRNSDPDGDYIISSEEQLALAFLTGREACLKTVLDTIRRDIERVVSSAIGNREREDLARYLKRYIDFWREAVYDIITQYSTIFLERLFQIQAQDNHTHAPPNATPNTKTSLTPPNKKLIARLHALITTHAVHALNTHLLPVISRAFPLLSLPLLSSSLTQLTYCATAFTRVGLDFRSMLSGIGMDAIQHIVTKELADIGHRWARRVRKSGLTSLDEDRRRDRTSLKPSKRRVQDLPSTWLVTSAVVVKPPLPSIENNITMLPSNIPPQILASYPPLAALTNALMNILNALRQLAPLDLFTPLNKALEENALSVAGESLLEYIKQVVKNPSDDVEIATKESKVARAAGQVYFNILVPFVMRAFMEGVYGVRVQDIGEPMSTRLGGLLRDWENW
ncbi:hypothetical protein AMATHDRAFT_123958, partial [Amanita thiersii Skay4041]